VKLRALPSTTTVPVRLIIGKTIHAGTGSFALALRAQALGFWSVNLGGFVLPSGLRPSYDLCVKRHRMHCGPAWLLSIMVALAPLPALAGDGAPAGYVLHAGDQLAVTVFGEPTLTQSTTLLPDGTITYPLVGQLNIGGQTVKAATLKLTSALQRYIKDPIVSISVTQLGSYNVLVLGNVKTPGKYALPSSARLADAIAAAGGLEAVNGEYPNARISIDNGPPVTASLQSLMREGDVNANIPLGDETVVYVPGPTPLQVQVIGSVDKPGTVEVHVGDRLAMAIAAAGTTTGSRADLSHIRVTHVADDGSTSVTEYNLYNALKNGDLGSDPVLLKNDVIYVPEAHAQGTLSAAAQAALLLLSHLLWF
jgi:polysaccharide biosynthesis/export protein